METPREVLFRIMQEEWGVSNKDLAKAILLDESVTSGKSPQELIEVRSSLSRSVVHVAPGECTYGWLAAYDVSVPRVLGLVKQSKQPHSSDDMVGVLSGSARDDMRASLDAHGLDGALYSNMCSRFVQAGNLGAADLAELLLSLFVVAGCSGDPATAATFTTGLANRMAASSALKTSLPSEVIVQEGGRSLSLGMYRCEDGVLLSDVYRLDAGPLGTEIGAMATAEHAVNDVGFGVSRRHARIFRDDAGDWWIEGLGSTNGTVHVNGADGTETVVEPPRAVRASEEALPVKLLPGDRIVLAQSTEFTIVALPAN